LDRIVKTEGWSPSFLDQVAFFRVSRNSPRCPIVYEPGIIIVGQGRKKGYLGDKVHLYDPDNYLVLSVPLPFECETIAEPGYPYLALSVAMEPRIIGELLAEMDEGLPLPEPVSGIGSTPLTEPMANAALRLVECLRSEPESRILGPQIVREITYHVLKGPRGSALRAVATRDSRSAQIARVLKRIHSDYARDLDIRMLADEAHMSVSAFHHSFKEVTSSSPLQYLKSIRLHKARGFLIGEGVNVGMAADRVGYASASQFSREYKRFFGESPREVRG
jgi:AraC-like DNA-binding protein